MDYMKYIKMIKKWLTPDKNVEEDCKVMKDFVEVDRALLLLLPPPNLRKTEHKNRECASCKKPIAIGEDKHIWHQTTLAPDTLLEWNTYYYACGPCMEKARRTKRTEKIRRFMWKILKNKT